MFCFLAPQAEEYVSSEAMIRAHGRPEEASKGREGRGCRLQGLDRGCWRPGLCMGYREACKEKIAVSNIGIRSS